MAITAAEARSKILDELALAADELALALACLGEAFEQLAVDTADRLEDELFRPVQKAYARAKREHMRFAAGHGLAARDFPTPSAGRSSQGAAAFVERADAASAAADHRIAELQDSMLPIESGDPELRAALAEIRELLAGVPAAARSFQRTLGR